MDRLLFMGNGSRGGTDKSSCRFERRPDRLSGFNRSEHLACMDPCRFNFTLPFLLFPIPSCAR